MWSGDEDEVDKLLEMELTASLQRHHNAISSSSSSSPAAEPSPASPSSSQRPCGVLTFSFPGWGVDMSRDQKRRRPSIVRHRRREHEGPEKFEGLEHRGGGRFKVSEGGESRRESEGLERRDSEESEGWEGTPPSGARHCPLGAVAGDGCHAYALPDEMIVNIMKRLSFTDLCSAIQTCHWWRCIGFRDDIWEQFCHGWKKDCAAAPGSLPNWAILKHVVLLKRVKKKVASRFAYLCKGFDHLRSVLRLWWETSWRDAPLNLKSLHSLIRKMTAHDWPVFYEFLAVVFSERADFLGNILMEQLFKANQEYSKYRIDMTYVGKSRSASFNNENEKLESLCQLSAGKLICEKQENIIGEEMWKNVITSWNQYKQWLLLVSTHCPELNYAVLSERARSAAWSTTPTVYDKGVICFRGQVLLKYQLRRVLQLGFSWLIACDSDGTSSELEAELLRTIYYLLQEVDVIDDFCLSANLFTQDKLNRCFPFKRCCSKVI